MVEDDDGGRVKFSCVNCGPCSHTKALHPQVRQPRRGQIDSQTHHRDIAHAKNHYSLMFWCILRNPTEVGFQHMVSVEERHLSVRLDPYLHGMSSTQGEAGNRTHAHLVLRVLSEVVQSSDMQLELAALAELAKARSKADEVGPCYRDTQSH